MPTAENNARYDLEDRLLDYAARIIRLAESVTRSPAGLHVAQQFLRSGIKTAQKNSR